MKCLPLFALLIPITVVCEAEDTISLTINVDYEIVKVDNLRTKQIQTRMVSGKKQERRQLCATVHAEAKSMTRTCIGYGPFPLPGGENSYHCFGIAKEKTDICLNSSWLECDKSYNWHVMALPVNWFPRFIRETLKACS